MKTDKGPKILQTENPILRHKAANVSPEEIGIDELKKIIKDMRTALASQEDGVAIAAPQIGVSKRIFLVSERIPGKKEKAHPQKETKENLVFINPKIVKMSKEKKHLPEGCLSVRWIYGEVKRASRVTIEALDEKGKKISRGAGGILAQIFQHEIDHLDGVLFIDKAKNIMEAKPDDYTGNKI